MWPFKKKEKSVKDSLMQEVQEAEALVAEKWQLYRQLEFGPEVSLTEQIDLFMEPALKGIIAAKPAIAFVPTELVALIFANGIVSTGTHTAPEVQDALGIPLGSNVE